MRRVAIDVNLLLLLVVGDANRSWIARHKRLKAYDDKAFDLLVEVIGDVSRMVVTPNVLTEVSNLACQGIAEPGCTQVRRVLAQYAVKASECYIESRVAVSHSEFLRLGLTDAVLLMNKDSDLRLWTDDLGLYLAAIAANLPVENFTHLRRSRGLL
jgi:hypothetical protein